MEVLYFNKKTEKFVSSLNKDLRSEITVIIDFLELLGNEIKMPHSKPIGGKLFELRTTGTTNIRLIYTYYDDKAWILHGFIKKSARIPKKELDYAQEQLRNLLH